MTRSLAIEESGTNYRRERASLIRLRGRWLRAAGFTPGQRVSVQVEQGRLVIVPADQQSRAADDSFTITCQRLDRALAQAGKQ